MNNNMNMMNNPLNWMEQKNNMAKSNITNMNLNNINNLNMMNNFEEAKIIIIFVYNNNEYKELCSHN